MDIIGEHYVRGSPSIVIGRVTEGGGNLCWGVRINRGS